MTKAIIYIYRYLRSFAENKIQKKYILFVNDAILTISIRPPFQLKRFDLCLIYCVLRGGKLLDSEAI